MRDYSRTVWKDHIKDQYGNVIQQGTPVSAQNLNNMEKQVVALSAKENTLAELVREAIPSGFTTLSDLDYTFMSTNPNQIKLISDSVAYVNGYKITIPAGTVITLDAPPTTGSRDDLVFLECWKQADANGSESWNYRLRVVDGVDFNKSNSDGFGNPTWKSSVYSVCPMAQGANASPIVNDDTAYSWSRFRETSDTTYGSPTRTDSGMYVAGSGDNSGKTLLGTVDGYVYAIPMFRVHRRNSSGYSASNGNGGSAYTPFAPKTDYTASIYAGIPFTIELTNGASLQVGDTLYYPNTLSQCPIIIAKGAGDFVTIMPSTTSVGGWSHTAKFYLCTRPDLMFDDIVADRDIIDLRHKVSLTGFNYQQLLEENFDKLLRGELQTSSKTTMLKTYHGIPKTPIDANHVFYASFDGTTVAEVGGAPVNALNTYSFANTPTGLGLKYLSNNNNQILAYNLSIPISKGSHATIDLMVTGKIERLITVGGLNVYTYLEDHIHFTNTTDNFSYPLSELYTRATNHFRFRFVDGSIHIMLNGIYIGTIAWMEDISTIKLFDFLGDGSYNSTIISDLSISNIDRGSAYATLPQDFIDGYARIAPAFNGQRQVFSDALTSQYTCEKVPASTSGRGKQFTVSQGTQGQWTSGDTIKVKGLGGEIITGVIDSDTALARVISYGDGTSSSPANTAQFKLDDVSKLSVNDTVLISDAFRGGASTSALTITAIDTTNNIIITNVGYASSNIVGYYIFETTASSSSPTVKTNVSGTAQAGASGTITLPSTFSSADDAYNNLDVMITAGTGAGQRRTISDYVGSTKVATVSSAWTTAPDATSQFTIYNVPIAGTWSGLGTSEATFTLGTLYALNTQDIQVEYSLNQVAGQGGISEVLTATLAGEVNGKKLTVNPTVHIRDDFAGKIAGDTTACPHKFLWSNFTSLPTPNQVTHNETTGFNDFNTQDMLDKLKKLDNVCYSISTKTNGEMAQALLQWNIVRMVEDKFGPIPAIDKIKWCRDNIFRVSPTVYANGSCPSGGKIYLKYFNVATGAYQGGNSTDWDTSTASSIVRLGLGSDYFGITPNVIDPNGMVSVLLHTDPSDGVTPSQVSLDYPYLDIVLKTPSGYDVLAPENPRRDDGKANILLVRKETKEIQVFMDASNTDGVVTYGDYVPYQGTNSSLNSIKVLDDYKSDVFITTHGTGGVIILDAKTLVHLSQLPCYYASDMWTIPNNIKSTTAKSSCRSKAQYTSNYPSDNYPSHSSIIGMLLNISQNVTSSVKGQLGIVDTYDDNGSSKYHTPFNIMLDDNTVSTLYPSLVFKPLLVKDINGNLLLLVKNNKGNMDIFIVKNRPLIK